MLAGRPVDIFDGLLAWPLCCLSYRPLFGGHDERHTEGCLKTPYNASMKWFQKCKKKYTSKALSEVPRAIVKSDIQGLFMRWTDLGLMA